MGIKDQDIQIMQAQVMGDVPEGGGGPSGTVVPDGVSNAIFDDVTDVARVRGEVNLEKVYAVVRTVSTDKLMGTYWACTQPVDAQIGISLFADPNLFGTRAQAAERMAAYLFSGPTWPGYLLENHISGMRAVQLFCMTDAELPPVGRTLYLVQDEGLATQVSQYVRVTRVSTVVRSFVDDKGTYQALVVTLEIGSTLASDFKGSPPSRYFSRVTGSTLVRDTVVADAAQYYGSTKLAVAAAMGDMSVRLNSIMTQLVPSAQSEVPLAMALPYAAAGLPVPGAAPVSYSCSLTWSSTTALYLPGGCLPGSLQIVTAGMTITDAAGVLKTASGSIGAIDYANGILTLGAGSLNAAKAITYTPAAQVLRAPQSTEIEVTAESRSQSYVGSVIPVPQPGTLSISYRAQGRWYTLSDGGDGLIKGLDASYGAGTVNLDTGAFVVTLGVLPDVGSSIILTWGVPTQETAFPSTTLKASHTMLLNVPAGSAVQPGSLAVAWNLNGVSQSATASNAGVLAGDASGTLSVAQGKLEFAPNVLPAVGTELTVTYVAGPKQQDAFAHPSRTGTGALAVTASLGSMVAGSVEVEWNTVTDLATLGVYTLDELAKMGVIPGDPTQVARDDGAGHLVLNGVTVGTVDYTSGAVSWNPDVSVLIPRPRYEQGHAGLNTYRANYSGIDYVGAPSTYPNDESGWVKLRYNSAGSTSNQTEVLVFAPTFRLVPGMDAQVVAGSVLLMASGVQPWGDSGQGTLREFTASGWLTRGAINYLSGDVTLTSWPAGTVNALTRASCVTTVGENVSSEFVFRTSAAPLRPGSLSIQYAGGDGGTRSVTADTSGVLSASGVSGSVDYETGLVRLRLGTRVVAAGNEGQPWYDAAAVGVDGKIFKPDPAATSSVRYSGVAYSYLPVDDSLLGISAVRLPADGRVPIFRKGGLLMLMAIGMTDPATVSNGQTISTARTRISRVRVVGSDGVTITTGYSADLDAGTVTFTDVTGYQQPVRIEHCTLDLTQCVDVGIDGTVQVYPALTHDYAAGAWACAVMEGGTRYARVSALFDQQTWDGKTWLDTISGDVAPASFNATLAPVVVTNAGAISERWALKFASTSEVDVIGEHVGNIGRFSINADIAPLNPMSGAPYFRMAATGWGNGWAAGNTVRLTTVGAETAVWIARTIKKGASAVVDDSFRLFVFGDVDRPAA